MSKPVVILKDAVVIDRSPDEVFELFADPTALMNALDVKGATARKLGNAQRWVMSHPDKLGDRVVDLSLAHHDPPDHLTWQARMRGFEIETEIWLAPEPGGEAETSTRLRIASKVRAETLRARLMAPILKLGKGRLQKGLRKSLKQISRKLRVG